MNVTKPTINALYDMIGQCFQYNRWLDRLVSVLGVKFACNNVAGLIHNDMAHAFPLLADSIGETCLERYNIPVEYQATPSGKQDYESVMEIMAELESKVIDFQNMFIALLKVAFENNDLHVYAELMDMMEEVNKFVEQVILLNDKAKAYGEDGLMSFDAHAQDHFWILGGE